MSSDSQLQQIGEEVLSNRLNNSPNNIPNNPNQDPIYLKSVDLSHSLNSIENSLSSAKIKEINGQVEELVGLLTSIGKGPSKDIGAEQSVLDSYKIICYSLLLIQKAQFEMKFTPESQSTHPEGSNSQEDLQNSYSQLIIENQNLIDENNLLSSESQKYHELKNVLCKKFNLPNDTDINDITSQLSSYELNDQEKHLSSKDQEIADLLTSREAQSKQIQDLKNEMNSLKLINHEENKNAKIYVLEADISSLTLQNKNLTTELSKQKDRYRTVNQNYQNASSEVKKKSQEIEDLQMKLNKLLIERDELQDKLNVQKSLINESNEKARDDQISGMNAIIEAFSKQIEDVTKELSDVSENRNQLFTLLHKQQLLIDSLERTNSPEKSINFDETKTYNSSYYIIHSLIEKLFKSSNNSSSSNNSNSSVNSINTDENNIKDSELIQILSNESQKSEDRIIEAFLYMQRQNQELRQSSQKEIKSPEKLLNQKEDIDNESSQSLHLLSLISETETDNETEVETDTNKNENDRKDNDFDKLDPEEKVYALKRENQRMCLYIMSILRFIDKVSNSSETQDWMLNSLTSTEIRDALVSQCKRVESFIKQRQIECEGFYSFTDLPKYVSSKIDEIADRNELITIVMMSALANDVLRKYLIKVEEQMETLTEELKAMKFEISHAEPSNNEELEQMKLDNIQMAQELKKIKKHLQEELTESNPITDIEKAKLIHKVSLAIKKEVGRPRKHSNKKRNKNASRYDEEDDDDESENYHMILETKLYDMIQKNEELENDIQKVSEEAKNAVHMLKKKIQVLQAKTKENEEQIESLSTNLENTQKELNDSNEKIAQKETDNKKLSETISELTSTITQMNERKQQEFDRMTKEMRDQLEEQIKKLEEEVLNKNNELHEKDEESVRKLKEMKKSYKTELKECKAALEKQNQRSTDIREYYEPLLTELRQKLADSREQNSVNLKDLQSHEAELKELKSEISTIKVESKMNQMKLLANEEKMKRDKNLFETQFKMKVMSMETSHSSEIEQLKSHYERQFHDFLVSISANFKEFIDFNSPITGESTTKLFQNVRQKIDSLKKQIVELETILEEIGDVRAVLNLSKDSDIIPRLTELSNKEKELERHSDEINDLNRMKDTSKEIVKKEEEVRKWEKWAKRVHATITDEFSSQKSSLELQFAIEEALMSSIGQRQIWRHIEILRSEKILLLKLAKDSPFLKNGQLTDQIGKEKVPNKNKDKKNLPLAIPVPDMLTLTLCFSAIYRLQKLSGHLHGAITFYDENNSSSEASFSSSFSSQTDADRIIPKKSKKKSDVSIKKYPILSFQ